MILPDGYREGMSREAIIEAYIEDGFAPERAEILARLLLSPPNPDLPII